MNELTIFMILFCAMFFFHELGHVAYAKYVGIYKGVTTFRLYHISKKLPQSGIWKLPLGVGTETDLEKETLHQRIFNCLSGVLAGLPFLALGWFILPKFECGVLVLGYLVGCSVDLVTVFQVWAIGRKEGFELKIKDAG